MIAIRIFRTVQLKRKQKFEVRLRWPNQDQMRDKHYTDLRMMIEKKVKNTKTATIASDD